MTGPPGAAAPKSRDRPPPVGRSIPTQPDPFSSLPSFDLANFEPPEWARNSLHSYAQSDGGETSRAGAADGRWGFRSSAQSGVRSDGEYTQRGLGDDDGDGDDDDAHSLGLSEQDEVWEDALENVDTGVDDTGRFTISELKLLLDKASKAKADGNTHFTAQPPRHEDAIASYRGALRCLPEPVIPDPAENTTADAKADAGRPDINGSTGPGSSSDSAGSAHHAPGKSESTKLTAPPPPSGSGIQELTEAEAQALEAELNRPIETEAVDRVKTEEEEGEEVMAEIQELRKVCFGNLGAVYLAQQGKEAECVEACKEALKIDPRYVKALQRRATANERIGSWSALTSAQEDYTLLLTLLPFGHPSLPTFRRALSTLPERIKQQQEKEKDEMLAKLKDLGNGILGRFGLSTDMFKFDQQEGGGYSMRFER